MVNDFAEANAADIPSFFFNLGDIVYYFGEATYYYDQFYEPYRNYPAPILAIPGNHDGVIYTGDPEPSLDAFLRNFCTAASAQSPDSGGLLRTTMIQPGVYFTLEAPFVRILGVYTNVLEDPGVISDENGANPALDQRQVAFLTAALKRVKTDNFQEPSSSPPITLRFPAALITAAARLCCRTSIAPVRPRAFGRTPSSQAMRIIISATPARWATFKSLSSLPVAAAIRHSRQCAPRIAHPTKSITPSRSKAMTTRTTAIFG